MFCVVCRSSRVGSGLGRSSSLRGRPRLRGGAALSGGGGSSFLSFVSFLAGFSRASISVASRAITPTMRPPSVRAISAACILSGRSPRANSAKARENVASEGTCERRSQPRMRRSDLSTARRSIRALVVGMPSIALATKALARAPILGRASGAAGRLRHKGFEADHVEGGDEATERFGDRVDFLAQPRKQRALDVVPARLHGVERIVCHARCLRISVNESK